MNTRTNALVSLVRRGGFQAPERTDREGGNHGFHTSSPEDERGGILVARIRSGTAPAGSPTRPVAYSRPARDLRQPIGRQPEACKFPIAKAYKGVDGARASMRTGSRRSSTAERAMRGEGTGHVPASREQVWRSGQRMHRLHGGLRARRGDTTSSASPRVAALQDRRHVNNNWCSAYVGEHG